MAGSAEGTGTARNLAGIVPIPDTILPMAKLRLLLVLLVTAAVLRATDQPSAPAVACADGLPGAPACIVSKETRKEARAAFERGLKLQKEHHPAEAYDEFQRAAELVPQDLQYLTVKELMRQQLVYHHIEQGNAALTAGNQVAALGEFRAALQLDPHNQFANQRLRDALGEWAPQVHQAVQLVAESGELHVAPKPGRQSFQFRGDSRALLSQVAAAFGITATFDDSVVSRHVRFAVDDVDFFTAMNLACKVTKTFWSSLEPRQILVALDSPENHRLFDRMMMRSFYLPDYSASGSEFNDVINSLRTLFDVRYIGTQPGTGKIIIRAPQPIVEAATQYLENLDSTRPEVLLDIQVYQISHTLMRNFGLHIPNQFTLINIPAAALAALAGQNIQDLINQLIANGGINQANSSAISGLLAQLQNQQNSIFSQPLATFGNGTTLFGLSLDQLSATLQENESAVRSLEHVTIRASQAKDATFHLGTRYPVINATFAPIYNTPAISQVLQNNTYINPIPSVNYEDLGLNLKTKPAIHGDADVTMELELQFRSLTGTSVNGVPVISNREYKGSVSLKNGEQAVVAGEVSNTEQRSLSGIPGLGQVPGVNKVMASNSMENDEDELLMVITPHILKQAQGSPNNEIWISNNR
jgi:general secretion pathway protein D